MNWARKLRLGRFGQVLNLLQNLTIKDIRDKRKILVRHLQTFPFSYQTGIKSYVCTHITSEQIALTTWRCAREVMWGVHSWRGGDIANCVLFTWDMLRTIEFYSRYGSFQFLSTYLTLSVLLFFSISILPIWRSLINNFWTAEMWYIYICDKHCIVCCFTATDVLNN